MQKLALAAAACVIAALGSDAALAFGGCDGRDVACYAKVRRPDVYETRVYPVVVRPGFSEVVAAPSFVMYRPKRLELIPGRWHSIRTPAVYGSRYEPVLVAPAKTTFEHVPAVWKSVRQTVVVRPGHVRWERRRDHFGREKLCKIRTKPLLKTVERDVLVAPERRIAHVTPARYAMVREPVLVARASVRHVYEPGLYAVADRPLVLHNAGQHVITHPAAVEWHRERVLVRRGGYAWVPERADIFDR